MTNESFSTLGDFKLRGMATAYEGILNRPHIEHPEAHELLTLLIEAEPQDRQRRRMQSYLRISKLRYAVTLQEVTAAPKRNLTAQQLSPVG